ncbi:MAG: translation initiation factor IF-2 [Proteobacteria bacterium]|nr:translation initiation factor IF-2 [Pseudomonadota bacterium]
MKVRAYKLAEELGLERDELIAKAGEIGIEIRSPMSGLDSETADDLRRRFGRASDVVTEDKRVGGTVVRRRRRKRAVEDGPAAAPAPTPLEEAEPSPLQVEAPVPLESTPEIAPEPPQSPPPVEPVVEEPEPVPSPAPPETGEAPPLAASASSAAAPRMTTPVKVVDDPLLNSEQRAPAAPAAGASETLPSLPEASQPAAGSAAAPDRGGAGQPPDRRPAARKLHRRQQVVQGQNLKEQETMARMMRGNVQAHLEKRRMLVEQQSRLNSRRRRGASGRRPSMVGERRKLVRLGASIPVADLSAELGVKLRELTRRAQDLGVELERGGMVESEVASLIASEYGFEVIRVETDTERAVAEATRGPTDSAEGDTRPPVVTVMGHVDHGKTSLLDAIRETRVVDGEAGGITQHIGAYQVEAGGQRITFIDTPGHAAFTQMRARGAQVTDIVVLVVAADDGVMPQTVEAINHARAAEVPIIVAVNKIDRPDADPQRVKQALLEHELVAEEFGGETICVDVSAIEGTNLDKLLEMIGLQAELLELRSPARGRARAVVVEASLDKGRGPVSTVLVQEGVLKRGDAVVVGNVYGRARSLTDDRGQNLKQAGPSLPVQLIGLNGVPEAGHELVSMKNEREAKRVAEHRVEESKRQAVTEPADASEISAEDLFAALGQADKWELRVVLKADVRGSVEATAEALEKLSTERVKLNVLHSGVGSINESDVMLAQASEAVIFGFHVVPEPAARRAAERDGVPLRSYDIVYELLQEAEAMMQGLLPARRVEKVLASANVKELFVVPRVGTVAGCEVTEGTVRRNSRVRVIRDGVRIYDGQLASLRRFKDDAREVSAPLECGMGIENYNDVKVGDRIEGYEVEETPDTL